MNVNLRSQWIFIFVLIIFCGCSKDEPKTDYPLDGLVSYYDFNNNKADIIGNSPDWISYGGTAFVETFRGQGLLFNGINGYVIIDRSSFHKNNQYSVSFWFKTPDDQNVSTFLSSQDFKFQVSLEVLYHVSTIPDQSANYTVFEDLTWTHIVGSFDGDRVKTYLNGVLHSLHYSPGVIPPGIQDLTIGRFNNTYWEGSLDELFIYNRALTQKEVTALYER